MIYGGGGGGGGDGGDRMNREDLENCVALDGIVKQEGDIWENNIFYVPVSNQFLRLCHTHTQIVYARAVFLSCRTLL